MNKHKWMAAVFWLLLIGPNVLYPFLKTDSEGNSSEKRTLASFPTISAGSFEQYPRDMEHYINDHAAFRNQFLSLNAALNLNLFDYPDSQDVIKGTDGWYFFAGGSSLMDCLGLGQFSEDNLAYINSCIQKTAAYFRSQGIEFLVVLPPNKEDIYREYLPSCYKQVTPISKGQGLSSYLFAQNDTIPIIDPRFYFKSQKNYMWYYKTDTHWNDAAGFAVSQQIIEALGGTPTPIKDVSVTYSPCEAGDLAGLFHMPDSYHTDLEAAISGYLEHTNTSLTDLDGTGGIVFAETKQAPDQRHIAFYRDSFGTAIANTLPKYFRQVDFYHWQSFQSSFLKERKPDVIIYEIVERDQGRIPDDMKALAPEAFAD